ncbi:hypothetical protein [Gilliamella sp. wkB72]|nr:hypothetical protein [Gilliamella apicola]
MRKIGSCERFYGFTTKVNQVEKRHIVKNNWVDIEYHYIIGRKE